MTQNMITLLAGDIGGTKTNLAIFTSAAGLRAPLAEATFPSSNYPSLEALVGEFLAQVVEDARSKMPGRVQGEVNVDRASFGVAGPVLAGRATVTNLPWVMDETQLAAKLGLSSVHLLNDLLAIAHAVPMLEPTDLHTLNEGEPASGGAIAVVAPGTGLGEAFLTWDGTTYRAYPSEGGHTDFAPTNSLEMGLLRYLQDRFDHISYERVCSGKGLPNIYNYLKESGYAEEPAWLAEELAEAEDMAPIIVKAALDENRSCELCQMTLNTFVSILGAEAGNMALKVLASGGVYLGGGIPGRILSVLEKGPFREAFRRKGRFSDLLSRIPIHVILNPKVALLGAASYGLNLPVEDPGEG
jgi:glucokinase